MEIYGRIIPDECWREFICQCGEAVREDCRDTVYCCRCGRKLNQGLPGRMEWFNPNGAYLDWATQQMVYPTRNQNPRLSRQ